MYHTAACTLHEYSTEIYEYYEAITAVTASFYS